MAANDYDHYAAAILRKLMREIGNPAVSWVPPPARLDSPDRST